MVIKIGAMSFDIDNRLSNPDISSYLEQAVVAAPSFDYNYSISLASDDEILQNVQPVVKSAEMLYQESDNELTIVDTFSSIRINRASKTMKVCPTTERYLSSLDFITDLKLLVSLAVLEQGGVLLHSSAIVHNRSGYVFIGKSGAGKSTVAGMLTEDPAVDILNDEFNILYCKNRQPFVCSTPFGVKNGHQQEVIPLKSTFILQKSTMNHSVKLDRRIQTISLLQNICSFPSDDYYGNLLLNNVGSLMECMVIDKLYFSRNHEFKRFFVQYISPN